MYLSYKFLYFLTLENMAIIYISSTTGHLQKKFIFELWKSWIHSYITSLTSKALAEFEFVQKYNFKIKLKWVLIHKFRLYLLIEQSIWGYYPIWKTESIRDMVKQRENQKYSFYLYLLHDSFAFYPFIRHIPKHTRSIWLIREYRQKLA